MTLDWQDGIPFSTQFGDVYFSADSGLAESRHVFLQGNALAERFAALSAGEVFTIGETGFGTGLNFLCVWQLFEQVAPPNTSLDFFSLEAYPLNDAELRAALALWPELRAQAEALLQSWNRRVPGWNRWHFAQGRLRLTLAIDDVVNALQQLPRASVDAWLLDGFSPAKNPAMWSENVFAALAKASHHATTLATYTSAGAVRRGLEQAGFSLEKISGFSRKREMLRGVFSATNTRKHKPINTPTSAIVIGGGVAGCAAANALAARGIPVTLIESSAQLARGGSGNPRGILHARFGAGNEPLHRFVIAAYGYALAHLDQVLPVDGTARAECGLLQLACNPVEQKRIARIAEKIWPENLLRSVTVEEASALVGMPMATGGLWFPAGGWLVPPLLCDRLANHARVTQHLSYTAELLTQSEAGWRVSGQNAQGLTWQHEAEIVVVCSAYSAFKFAQFDHLPLTAVRGQISQLPASLSSRSQRAVVCGDGYCAPAVESQHVIGATHAFDDFSCDERTSDHAENLAKLAAYAPALRQSFGQIESQHLRGRASQRCSAPGSMPLVGEMQSGLYCSLAHGTRGLLTAGIAAETMASLVCGQLPPLPTEILAALSPTRYAKKSVSF